MMRALYAAVIFTISTQASFADECIRLWVERNSIFDANGYCFQSELGSGYFDNSDCYTQRPTLTTSENTNVASIQQREAILGCRSQRTRWTVADIRDVIDVISAATDAPRALTQDEARRLQVFLNQSGHYSGAIDGAFGPISIEAMNSWLVANGLQDSLSTPLALLNHFDSQNDIVETDSTTIATVPTGTRQPIDSDFVSRHIAACREYAANPSPPTAPNELELWDSLGLQFDYLTLLHPDDDQREMALIYVSAVAPDSEAIESDIAPCHILEYDSRRPYVDLQSVSQYIDNIQRFIGRAGVLEGTSLPLEYSLALFEAQGDATPSWSSILATDLDIQYQALRTPFLIPRDLPYQHFGISLREGNYVDQIRPGSPADVAGFFIGDRLHSLSGQGIFETHHIFYAYRQLMETYLRSDDRIFDVYVIRNGREVRLDVPPRRLGEPFAFADIPETYEHAFNELPEELQDIFRWLFVGDFDQVELYKDALFDQFFTGSALQLVAPLFSDLNDQIEESLASSRLEPTIAQYILVKSSNHGHCGEPTAGFVVTEQVIRTVRNGFGVILSENIMSEDRSLFFVPQRFADIVETAEVTSEFAPFSDDIGDFIAAMGGCDSVGLRTLEDNMISYVNW